MYIPLSCVLLASMAVGARPSELDQKEVLEELDTVLSQISDILKHDQDTRALPDEQRDKRYHGRGCPSRLVQCPGSRVCVSKGQFCDGRSDCPRGMDERKAKCRRRPKSLFADEKRGIKQKPMKPLWPENETYKPIKCGADQIACGGSHGKCISRDFLCDGYVDCYEDAWDESSDLCGKMANRCSHGMIACNKTQTCIYPEDLCNNIPDCEDHEDESVHNCGERHCPPATTKCPSSNLCLEDEYWCDEYKDCIHGEDEEKSYCEYVPCDGLRCSDGLCVHSSAYCDSIADCKDGADEDIDRCGPVTCKSGTIRCKPTNSCVSMTMTCDGIKDCPDGSDENEDVCKGSINEPSEDFYRRTAANEDGDDVLATKKRLTRLLQMLANE